MTPEEEAAYEAYIEAERGAQRLEKEDERAWLRRAEYSPEAYDEMVRQDREGLS